MTVYPFSLQPLPYDYDALEPYIAGKIMELHHDRHLRAYVNQLNAALKPHPELQRMRLEQLIRSAPGLPEPLGTQVSRNAGGVYNHQFFFESMTPAAGQQPHGQLEQALCRAFGSPEEFRRQFLKAASGVFGSGYAWLVRCPGGGLRIVTTANQETPLCRGLCPILNLDVWEHAYYLQYYNVRADYISAWWNVVNWDMAERRYKTAPHSRSHAERD